jgi:hypothetical protein
VSRELSFTGGLLDRDPQDYDNDAIVCHMGAFVVPDAPVDAAPEDVSATGDGKDTARQSSITPTMLPKSAVAAVAAAGAPAELELLLATDRGRNQRHRREQQQLHLYTIAAPGMRRPPQSMHDLARVLGWAEPVRSKPGWLQVQKSYFSAPGALMVLISALLWCALCLMSQEQLQFALQDSIAVWGRGEQVTLRREVKNLMFFFAESMLYLACQHRTNGITFVMVYNFQC